MNISISRIFFTLCLFMVLLTSCNNQKTKIKIESNLDKIDDIFSIDRSEKDNMELTLKKLLILLPHMIHSMEYILSTHWKMVDFIVY